MSDGDKQRLMDALVVMQGRILHLESRVKAATAVLIMIAEKSGYTSKQLLEFIDQTAEKFYEDELLRVEAASPQLAAQMDLRPSPGGKRPKEDPPSQ
jgi:hypothetical protein